MIILKFYLIVFAIDAVLIAIHLVNERRLAHKRIKQMINEIFTQNNQKYNHEHRL